MKKPFPMFIIDQAPILVLVCVVATFSVIAPGFFNPSNLWNTLHQATSTGILAVGITFVLLTAGVDLSVGAIMFIVASIGGKLLLNDYGIYFVLPLALIAGSVAGSINGVLISRYKLIPFIVTLSTLYLGRGFSLWFTQTRAMNLPDQFLDLGAARFIGVPLPVILFAAVAVLGHITLKYTPFGRQIYAIGNSPSSAKKAGLKFRRIIFSVYVISGVCAALASLVTMTQLGAISPTFGLEKEFAAIAAAVLGGTSLFGGRGNILPGTIVGAVLIQTVENGLVFVNADPYLYPLVSAFIIFVATLADSQRTKIQEYMRKPRIRPAN